MRVVPALDVLEDGQVRRGLRREAVALEQLAFEGREEALAECLSYASPTEPIDGWTPISLAPPAEGKRLLGHCRAARRTSRACSVRVLSWTVGHAGHAAAAVCVGDAENDVAEARALADLGCPFDPGPRRSLSSPPLMRLAAQGHAFGSLAEVMAKANEAEVGRRARGHRGGRRARARGREGRARGRAGSARSSTSRSCRPSSDELTRAFLDALESATPTRALADWTVGELREHLLADAPDCSRRSAPGSLPEMAAAVAKLMSNLDLMLGGAQAPGRRHGPDARSASPAASRRASSRTTRATASTASLASTLEGLAYGCGDAVLGVNPVDDRVEVVAPHRRRAPGRSASGSACRRRYPCSRT